MKNRLLDAIFHRGPGYDLAPVPKRGDQFEDWLKQQRDLCIGDAISYNMADGLLDQYRLHADTGTPLNQHCCTAHVLGDCACLEEK